MKILHVNNVANIAWYLAQGQRSLGHQATVVIREDTTMWPGDVVLRTRGEPLSWNAAILRHWRLFRDADVIHIHGGIWRSQLAYGLFRRLFPRKAFVIHLHGSETRSGLGLHHLEWGDAIVCSTPDLVRFVPTAQWVPNPHSVPDSAVPPSRRGRVVIGHFPSRRSMKGTAAVLEGFDEFVKGEEPRTVREEGVTRHVASRAELWVVEGVPHARAMELMRHCDIVIDQIMPYGIYSLVSVEGMALGKVVISSYNPDYYGELPIVRATSDAELREALRELLMRRERWRRIGEEGRAYVRGTHDAPQVAGRFLRLYYDLLSGERWDRTRAREYWLKRGKGYLAEFQTGEKRLEKDRYARQEAGLESVLSQLEFQDFVEVGCGFGRITQLLCQRPDTKGYAIDLSVDQLRSAREVVGKDVPLARADATFLPFRDRSADLVLATEVLMHLPPQAAREALNEMARVARKYVVNLDWYERYAIGTERDFCWIHDYPSFYVSLGLEVTIFAPQPRALQAGFLGVKP